MAALHRCPSIDVVGRLLSTTGIAAVVGVPAIVVSSGVVAGGAANVAAGVRGLFTTGSGSSGPAVTRPAPGGEVWNKNGGVDFSKSEHLYPVVKGQKNIVKIQYTGSRRGDNRAANQAAGLGNSDKAPKGYTWHHLDDYDPATNTGTMQLVDIGAHQANAPHSGGVQQYVDATGTAYR